MTCGLIRLILEEPRPPGQEDVSVVYDLPKDQVNYYLARLKAKGWTNITIIEL
jgi:hypothetical protein